MENWLTAPWDVILKTIASAIAIFVIIIIYVRIAGLRTFAKMSSFDFASTIAIGTILASTLMNTDSSLLKGAVALGTILGFQQMYTALKIRSKAFADAAENDPVLLMDGSTILYDNLHRTNVSQSDLMAKLREANVLRMSQVMAVVLETTGDISVLHQEGSEPLDDILLEGVQR
ncbi:uncharacterized protein DUF421 [Neolewinella xylanilytica]|uniref:Uncharacterized protein DUF421 n=1 Tax=Neolewinella xylanilytica TaxID=1514080 RepID=A0A2S6I6L7_9BACT|nr:YetF domain-containing protein [Neolewinella xylanilytica]PPK87141.1 uncharacterized protein DUF421 [Neolewinella xylanilytica]